MFLDIVTVFNRVYDKNSRIDIYYKTVISNVHFEERKGANIIKSGLQQSDKVFLVIPYSSPDKLYLENKAFDVSDNKENFFTLKLGDVFVKGAVLNDFTNLKELGKNYEYYTITNIDFYGFGSSRMLHWEVSGS